MRNKLAIVFLSIAAATAAVAQSKETAFKPGPAASYPSHQTMGKVKFAAVKYESDAETRAAFGKVNPNEYGILPVFLIIQNDGDQNLLLDRMDVKLQAPDRSQVDPTPAQDLPYVISPKAPGTGPKYPSPIPIQIKKKNPLSAVELDSRKFAARAVLPGESATGFFYYRARYKRNAFLYVTGIREASTGKELFFLEVPIDPATPAAP
ncbi:MAG: hypothetical protein IT161_00300 [Bryobacterales bacterium]|nr:hypothetical protein [Bryobacterales bacterium]